MDWNAVQLKIMYEDHPKYANEIEEAVSIGFHLKCLRCGKTYYHTRLAMSEMGYRKYSYCDNCIDEAVDFLNAETARKGASEWVEDSDPGQEYGTTWTCFKCRHDLHMPKVWNPKDMQWRYCPHCGRRMTEDGEMGDEQVGQQ